MNTTATTATALPVACITCKAEAHADCVTPTGLAAKATHIARIRDNEKAPVLLADEDTTDVPLVESDNDEEILAGIVKATEARTIRVHIVPEVDEKAAVTIAAVRAHAEKFVHQNGWDFLVEAMTDTEILAVIGNSRSTKGAVNKARKHCKALDSNRAEIVSA